MFLYWILEQLSPQMHETDNVSSLGSNYILQPKWSASMCVDHHDRHCISKSYFKMSRFLSCNYLQQWSSHMETSAEEVTLHRFFDYSSVWGIGSTFFFTNKRVFPRIRREDYWLRKSAANPSDEGIVRYKDWPSHQGTHLDVYVHTRPLDQLNTHR